MTVWDYAKEGNVRKMKQMIDSGRFSADQGTLYLKMTPLHIAVKHLQLDVIKTLLYDYGVDPSHSRNSQGKTALDLCETL
jgi:ankyrin repeat protein